MSICVRASVGNALGIRVSWLSLAIKEVMLRVSVSQSLELKGEGGTASTHEEKQIDSLINNHCPVSPWPQPLSLAATQNQLDAYNGFKYQDTSQECTASVRVIGKKILFLILVNKNKSSIIAYITWWLGDGGECGDLLIGNGTMLWRPS